MHVIRKPLGKVHYIRSNSPVNRLNVDRPKNAQNPPDSGGKSLAAPLASAWVQGILAHGHPSALHLSDPEQPKSPLHYSIALPGSPARSIPHC